ncbi:hypothetical protein [Bacillus salipaludis]|uniref:hypothetical protein n=1 Tax=Bacillus salipaludis TaxID=2547811 RepID=UPI002E21726C|nr:hypothetical protein [Bacillus salipaludis]
MIEKGKISALQMSVMMYPGHPIYINFYSSFHRKVILITRALERLSGKHFSIYKMTRMYQMAFGQGLYKVKQWIEKQI